MNINSIVYDISKSMNISLASIARSINQSPQNFSNKIRRGTLSLNELEQIANNLNIDFSINYELPHRKISLRNNSIANNEILEFAIFCIEKLRKEIGISGKDAYNLLSEQTTLLYQYIVKNYEVLHTQGEEYIINDLKEVLDTKKVRIWLYIMVPLFA